MSLEIADLAGLIEALDLGPAHIVGLLGGAASASSHNLIVAELLVTLTDAERTIIEVGTHEMCVKKPAHCGRAIEAFIKGR